MFGSDMIEIAIGMIFVFLLISLVASTINEFILSLLNMRGRVLLTGLKTLLNDPDAKGLVNKVYNHGQIFGLFRGDFNPKKPGNLPSYIPAQNFVMALLDVVPAAAAPAGQQAPVLPAPEQAPPVQLGPQQAAGQQAAAARALLDSLRAAAQTLAQDASTEKVGKPLISMINAAGNDVAKLKKSLEDWFNSVMDRVSGWYKYRTQHILFGIGFVLALALNADAVKIVRQLSKDSTLRQSIVAAAQSAKQPTSNTGQLIADQIKQAKEQVSNIEDLGIPLGWTNATLPPAIWHMQSADLLWAWLRVLSGWLFTAFAVSLGAPFWFDMLNKIMVVRSTVKPGEKSQEEASKEPKQ